MFSVSTCKYAVTLLVYVQAVYGVRGKSVLHTLPDFDIINNDPVDYMHCVLLGVVRTLVSLWFDTKHHREPWLVSNIIMCIIISHTLYI